MQCPARPYHQGCPLVMFPPKESSWLLYVPSLASLPDTKLVLGGPAYGDAGGSRWLKCSPQLHTKDDIDVRLRILVHQYNTVSGGMGRQEDDIAVCRSQGGHTGIRGTTGADSNMNKRGCGMDRKLSFIPLVGEVNLGGLLETNALVAFRIKRLSKDDPYCVFCCVTLCSTIQY